MATYLLTVTDENARQLERWLGGMLHIGPAHPARGVPVAGLDALTEEERLVVRAMLRKRGPFYHSGVLPDQEADVVELQPLPGEDPAEHARHVLAHREAFKGWTAEAMRAHLWRQHPGSPRSPAAGAPVPFMTEMVVAHDEAHRS
jgi:hypothetical protein